MKTFVLVLVAVLMLVAFSGTAEACNRFARVQAIAVPVAVAAPVTFQSFALQQHLAVSSPIVVQQAPVLQIRAPRLRVRLGTCRGF